MKRNKYGYLAKNTILFTISSFSSKLLSFLLVPLYTNVLSTSDYGTADIVSTTSYLLLFVVTVNIAEAILRFVIEKEQQKDEIFGYGIKVILKGNLGFMLALIIFAYFNPIHWDYYLYVFIFLNVFFTSFLNITSNYLRAIDQVKDVAVGGIISTIITIICNLFTLLVLKIGIVGYLVSMIAGPLSATIFYFLKCKNVFYAFRHSTKDKQIQKAMLAYSLPLILNGVAWWISASLDKYFIVGFLGPSENGIYSVAQKIPMILTTFSTIFMQAWNLSAIKEFDKNDNDGFFTNVYKIVNTVLVVGCSLLILFNITIARILYANEFFVAWKCSSWLLISVVFSSMSSFEGSVFSAVKNTRIVSISTAVSALINTILNFVLIPFWGVQGAAIATVVSFFFVWLIRYVLLKKIIKFRINIVIDIILYSLLIVQVLLERIDNHCYMGQIIISLIIIILNKNNFIIVWEMINLKLKRNTLS